jgi:hypothetical protein
VTVRFNGAPKLEGVYFLGNAPGANSSVFLGDDNLIVYYPTGAAGWGREFDGVLTAPWSLRLRCGSVPFGVGTNGFGFSISGIVGLVVVVEASTNLDNPIWSALATNTLTSGSAYFSDPQWTDYPTRFYRLRSP